MIQEFVDRFIASEAEVKQKLRLLSRGDSRLSYKRLVELVVETIRNEHEYETPSPERVHQIDDGDYQGTKVFVIGASGYQPYTYWYVYVAYGSCSGCDSLEAARSYRYEGEASEQEIQDYWTLALHIVQRIREMYA